MKQNIAPTVKGTRDFYPEQFAFRDWLYGKIREVSGKFGYQEYDGPEIEYLDLYAGKTSQEILKEQTFTLKDRDGKTLVLRPELTPTFARMVAQKAQQLPKPIRWFSFGRVWRYEQPQRGRGREFFQWEINILGPETPEADAEILSLAAEYLISLGLTPEEVTIRVSDRQWLQDELKNLGVALQETPELLHLLDRRDKMESDEFIQALSQLGLTDKQIQGIEGVLQETDYNKSPWLKEVFSSLSVNKQVLSFIEFDPQIIRGFEYYTRTVFEAWDKTGKFRSIFGGGRFDNLTSQIGGERVPGIGFAVGDMMTQVILEANNKMPQTPPKVAKVLVTVFAENLYPNSLELSSRLRSNSIDCETWVEVNSKLEKQLKYADQKKIPFAIIIGPEEAAKELLTLKDLAQKSQRTLTFEEAIKILNP